MDQAPTLVHPEEAYENKIDAPLIDSLTGVFNQSFFTWYLSRRYSVPSGMGLIFLSQFQTWIILSSGDDISMMARIMDVADIYDVLVTDRPYRPGFSRKKAIAFLSEEAESGKLDSIAVDTLIDMMGQ